MNIPLRKTAKIFTFSVCLFSLSYYASWWHNIPSSSNYGKIANILRTLPVCLFPPLFLISLKVMATKQLRDINFCFSCFFSFWFCVIRWEDEANKCFALWSDVQVFVLFSCICSFYYPTLFAFAILSFDSGSLLETLKLREQVRCWLIK